MCIPIWSYLFQIRMSVRIKMKKECSAEHSFLFTNHLYCSALRCGFGSSGGVSLCLSLVSAILAAFGLVRKAHLFVKFLFAG